MERHTSEQRTRDETRPVEVVDPHDDRPGVPMEADPEPASGAHWESPTVQAGASQHLHRAGLDHPTPVVGTAQPPHGVSGLLRKQAYRIPERFARHWALLFLADRVDVLEDRIGPALAQPLEELGFSNGSRYVRRNPLGAMAGLLFGLWVTKRMTIGR